MAGLPFAYIAVRLLCGYYFPTVPPASASCTAVDYETFLRVRGRDGAVVSVGPRGFVVRRGEWGGEGEEGLRCWVLEVGDGEEERREFRERYPELGRVLEGFGLED